MTKLVKIVRKEKFDQNSYQFRGSFPPGCQGDSVPTSLKSIASMLLNGTNVKNQDATESQACLTISQMICFNAKSKTSSAVKYRHSKDREPLIPLYLGLNIHTLTRSKKIVNNLYRLGISISYARIIVLENLLASAVCKQYEEEGLVCPSHLQKGLFTVGALDNIDHNSSSTTAQGSFHGTGINIFQFPTADNSGIHRDPITIEPDSSSSKYCLPESYTTVLAVFLQKSKLAVPETTLKVYQHEVGQAKAEQVKWIDQAIQLLTKDRLGNEDYITWAAFHSSLQPNPVDPVCLECSPTFIL